MPVDTSAMTPAELSQYQMFKSMTDAMPTEALALLRDILDEEIRARPR